MAAKKTSGNEAGAATKEEQVGFHKGSLSVLAKEREEMGRILNIVEQLMQMHVNALKELGIDLESEAEKLGAGITPGKSPGKPKNKPPIEDIL